MIENEKSNWLTPSEAGLYLGVETTTIYKYIKLEVNPLPCIYITPRTIRINQEKLEEWIKSYNLEGEKTKCQSEKK